MFKKSHETYKFDMAMTNIPFPVYDVIFYLGATQAQFGDGTGLNGFNHIGLFGFQVRDATPKGLVLILK